MRLPGLPGGQRFVADWVTVLTLFGAAAAILAALIWTH